MTTEQFRKNVQAGIDAKIASAAQELTAIEAYAQACNVDAHDMASAIRRDPLAAQQFQEWKIETGRS